MGHPAGQREWRGEWGVGEGYHLGAVGNKRLEPVEGGVGEGERLKLGK